MADLSLDEIAERIINVVLNERYINKESLTKIIKPILKIWLKKADSFKSQKAPKSKLQSTIESRNIQQKYWLGKVRELLSEDDMKVYYNELDELLFKEGYKSKRDKY